MNNKLQKLWLVGASATVATCSVISGATPLVGFASVVGILFVVGVAFGHKLANLFGAILAACMMYLSYQAGYFGNVLMNGFTVMASLWGWWYWTTHQGENGVERRSLTSTQIRGGIALLGTLLVASLCYSKAAGSALWYLDGITSVLPVFATILLVGAYRQQWYLWIPYNALEVVMWFFASSAAPEMLAILVMRIVFFINSLIGFKEWNK